MKDSAKIKKEMLKNLKKTLLNEDDMGLKDSLGAKKMSKVVVAAPDKKGLEEGLSKAQEILKKRSEMFGGVESEESEEPAEEMEDESEEMDEEEMEGEESKEDLKAQIEALKAKLEK
jgi:hypothetical protein